jgi:dTDP-4-dehydrorhamnose reductase
MKRLLVLGSAGMLGHVVFTYLKESGKYNIFDASFPVKNRPESTILDATDKNQVEKTIELINPDIIINCIGILIKGSREDTATSIYLNSFLPHLLSKLQQRRKGKLIHVSTDCVFTGLKGSYTETDFKDARDHYGLSKALGEVVNEHDLTFRTSIIGPEIKENGEGLFKWFMSQKGTVSGYTKVLWGGVTTLELAKAIDCAIDQDLCGLYNLTPGYPISKYDLLKLMKKTWNIDYVDIVPDDSKVSDKSLKTLRSDFIFKVGTYEEMLIDLFAFMNAHKNFYRNYFY